MQPWYIATETFTPRHEGWPKYIAWSRLTQFPDVKTDSEVQSQGVLQLTPSIAQHLAGRLAK
jgi:hypothetical protein